MLLPNPWCLNLKLAQSRFEYDRERGTKRKILTDIQYELTLNVPSGDSGSKETHLYSLYAIVVHSGTSSDSGHYYTYAREPKVFDASDCQVGLGSRKELGNQIAN